MEISNTTEWSVTWFTFAMIVAGIAQGKNRSGLNWFLLSLILGPFALFLLLVSNKIPFLNSPQDSSPE